MNLIAWTTFNFSIIPSFKIQDLEHYSLFQNSRFRNRNHRLIPQPPFQNFQNDHLMWYLSIETPLRQNSIRLLYLTCPELFSKSCYLWLILEDLPTSAPRKKNRAGVFFDKIVGLNHQNLLTWKPTIIVFLGITEIIISWIFENSYYLELLQNYW